jgi:hypothetical protein
MNKMTLAPGQNEVHEALQQQGPMTDSALAALQPKQSAQGIRTRRAFVWDVAIIEKLDEFGICVRVGMRWHREGDDGDRICGSGCVARDLGSCEAGLTGSSAKVP